MKIHWENIRWETDDVGTSWATVADEEHNSLTLENRDGTITFHTDGNPRFDVSTILDLTALCAALSKNALGQIGGPPQSPEPACSSPAPAAGILVPEQRHTRLTQDDEVEPKVGRLPRNGSSACHPDGSSVCHPDGSSACHLDGSSARPRAAGFGPTSLAAPRPTPASWPIVRSAA